MAAEAVGAVPAVAAPEVHVEHARAADLGGLAEGAVRASGLEPRLEGLCGRRLEVLGELAEARVAVDRLEQEQVAEGSDGVAERAIAAELPGHRRHLLGVGDDLGGALSGALRIDVVVLPLLRVPVPDRDHAVVVAVTARVLVRRVQRGDHELGNAVRPHAAPVTDRVLLRPQVLRARGRVVDLHGVGVAVADLRDRQVGAVEEHAAVGVGAAVGGAVPDAVAAEVRGLLGDHEELEGVPVAPGMHRTVGLEGVEAREARAPTGPGAVELPEGVAVVEIDPGGAPVDEHAGLDRRPRARRIGQRSDEPDREQREEDPGRGSATSHQAGSS